MITKNIQKNKGFVLLYVTVLSSIILAIALGVLSIAAKEVNFSTSGKDTNDAFFAADTGAECALYHDKGQTVYDPFPNEMPMSCAGSGVSFVSPSTPGSGSGPWTFTILNLGDSGQSCAIVTVTRDTTSTYSPTTTIVSKGYNNGGSGTCGDTINYVQRELDVTY